MNDIAASARLLAVGRLIIAAVQGSALWYLSEAAEQKSWPATDNPVFSMLLALALFLPVIAIAGLGKLRPWTLAGWLILATALCAGLGFHAGYREGPAVAKFESWLTFAAALGGLLFIAHTLVVAGDSDRRWIARFPTYFDIAWRHATQLALAALFVGVFWIVLELGAELFRMIGIRAFTQTLEKDWFWIPATAFAASMALHLVDSRTNMVRGTRTLVLGLLSWLLPVMTLIGLAFLGALPFTGLEPLWSTRHATVSLLAAAILLILLINSHFQDGRPESGRPGVLTYAGAIAAVMLAPLVALAAVGLTMRVEQHGWSPSRIVALAVVVATAWHALGYLVAVARSGTGLRDLPITNVLSAIGIVALMIALLTPLADPARLAVADQMARLRAGRIALETLDFYFLERGGGRYGRDALERLKAGPDATKVAELAKAAIGEVQPQPATEATRRANIKMVRPGSPPLPVDFLQGDWNNLKEAYLLPSCLTLADQSCEGFAVDLASDGSPQLVLADGMKALVFAKDAHGEWHLVGEIANLHCKGAIEALRSGNFATVPSAFRDIEANGARWPVTPFCER